MSRWILCLSFLALSALSACSQTVVVPTDTPSVMANAHPGVPALCVGIAFDRTASGIKYLPFSHFLLQEVFARLRDIMPGLPEDRVIFTSIDNAPEVVKTFDGSDARSQAEQAFLSSFRSVSQGLGTDIAGGINTTLFEMQRVPGPVVRLLIVFSDGQVDDTPGHPPFLRLNEMDWGAMKNVHVLFLGMRPGVMRLYAQRLGAAGVQVATSADLGFDDPAISRMVLEHRSRRLVDDLALVVQSDLQKHADHYAAAHPEAGDGLGGALAFGAAALAFFALMVGGLHWATRRSAAAHPIGR